MHPVTSITLLCIMLCAGVSSAHAYGDAYYARSQSERRGSELERFIAAAEFSFERSHASDTDRSEYFCALQRLLPQNRGGGFAYVVSQRLSTLLNLDTTSVSIALVRARCDIATPVTFSNHSPPKHLRIDSIGRVVSRNPVWNSCIRGTLLTPAQLRSNPDVFVHRQRSISVRIPYSCRDYHRGEVRSWIFPDDPSIELVLDARGRLLGDAPAGYILVSE